MDIPLSTQDDIFAYGFDKGLNRNTEDTSLINNTEKIVEDMLAKAGINLNTTSGINSGGSGNFERNDFHWLPVFESLDGYPNTGTVTISSSGFVRLATAGTTNATSTMSKQLAYSSGLLTWNKNRKMRTMFDPVTTAAQLIYILVGNRANNDYMGFKIIDNTIYGVSNNGSESTLNCGTFTTPVAGIALEFRFFTTDRVDYYVDNVFKGSIKTNLPIGTTTYANQVMDLYIKTTEDVAKNIDISYWDFWQAN